MQENNDRESAYKLPTAPVELEAIDEVSTRKKTEAQDSTAYGLSYPPTADLAELEGTTTAMQESIDKETGKPLPTAPVELWGSKVNVEMDRRPLPQIKLSSQESVQRADISSSWGQEKGKGERVQADEWPLSDRTRKAGKPENWNYF